MEIERKRQRRGTFKNREDSASSGDIALQSDPFALGKKIFEYANNKAEAVSKDFIDGLRGVYKDYPDKRPSNIDLIRGTMSFLTILITDLQLVIFGEEDQENLDKLTKLLEEHKKSLDKRRESYTN